MGPKIGLESEFLISLVFAFLRGDLDLGEDGGGKGVVVMIVVTVEEGEGGGQRT